MREPSPERVHPSLPMPITDTVLLPTPLIAELRRIAGELNGTIGNGRREFGHSKVLGVLAEALWRIAGPKRAGLPRELLEAVLVELRLARSGRPMAGVPRSERGGRALALWAKVADDWRGLRDQHVIPGFEAMGLVVPSYRSVGLGRIMLGALRWRPNPGTWGLTEPEIRQWLDDRRDRMKDARDQLLPTAQRWRFGSRRIPKGWPIVLEEHAPKPRGPKPQWFDAPLQSSDEPLHSGTDECEAGSEV